MIIERNLRVQTTAVYSTERPKSSITLLDNLVHIYPGTYHAGVQSLPANSDYQLITSDINNVFLICQNSFFEVSVESDVDNYVVFEDMRHFTYSSKKPVKVFIKNKNEFSIDVHVLYCDDLNMKK